MEADIFMDFTRQDKRFKVACAAFIVVFKSWI